MEMNVLHKGFDGLDAAFEGQIPSKLDELLAMAKAGAAKSRGEVFVEHNGIDLLIAESGARGGYAFRCDTGPLGAVWFFKRPNPNDPWGIRVSVKSLPLAKYGLGWARHYIHETLETLGIIVSTEKMGISRVDYAIDILMPNFLLNADHFVTHSRSKRKTHQPIEHINTVGHSGRTTSVTIGSNPGRQIIVYDKREEVLGKAEKAVWWNIWNANLQKQGRAPLVSTDPKQSQVWRVEMRAYKRHLKDAWHINTWEDLDHLCGDVFAAMIADIRHTSPTSDTNRARWPNSCVWQRVKNELSSDLIEMKSDVSAGQLKEVIAEQHKQTLLSLFLGIGVSIAALEAVKADKFPHFLDRLADEAKEASRRHNKPLTERLKKAAAKYVFIRPPVQDG